MTNKDDKTKPFRFMGLELLEVTKGKKWRCVVDTLRVELSHVNRGWYCWVGFAAVPIECVTLQSGRCDTSRTALNSAAKKVRVMKSALDGLDL